MDRDIEQVDFGIGYRGHQSPQQHMNLHVSGGSLAIALSLLSIGGLVIGASLIPAYIRSEAGRLTERALVRSDIAEREVKIAREENKHFREALAQQGIVVEARQ